MRLSQIKLAGFKSFVDPTLLPLPSNRTGIVGPNGCGKSNLIDAVRWVLGETSMKQLRGQDSDDVIFNGSRTRKPVGRASVELTFDNSDGQMVGPWAAYAEIAVRREIQRDGQSQYFVNGRKSLKRDAMDLFLGTGLGGRNQYAIIEQGMVSRMIEARPEELRTWLEEAAGISRYKERRRETENRIRQTRENLDRLEDLRQELVQRLETLRRQAANAEKFTQFREQERRLRAELLLLRERAIEREAAACEAAVTAAQANLDAARAEVEAATLERADIERAQRSAQERLNECQARVYEAEAAQSREIRELEHARQLLNMKQAEVQQVVRQIAEVRRRAESEQMRRQTLQNEIESLNQQLSGADEAEAQAEAVLESAESAEQAAQQAWDEVQVQAEQPLRQVEAERIRVQQLERMQLQHEERLKRLDAERATLDAEAIRVAVQTAEEDLAALEFEIEEAEIEIEGVEEQLLGLRDASTDEEQALHDERQRLQVARGRLASLEALQQAAMRNDDATLNRWLAAQGLAQQPRLAQSLQVDEGWEFAVEQVLEAWLQAPVVDGLEQVLPSAAQAPESGLRLLADGMSSSGQGGDTLAARVRGPEALLTLLAGVHIADDEAAAQARLAALAVSAGQDSVITPDGVWRGHGWARYPRRGEGEGGVIARERALKALRDEVATLDASLQQREQRLQAHKAQQQSLEQIRRERSQRLEQARSRHAQRQAFRQSQAVRLEQTELRLRALDADRDSLREQRAQQGEELLASRDALIHLEQEAARLRELRSQRQIKLAACRDAVTRARSQQGQVGQRRSQLQVQLASRESALTALAQTVQDLLANAELLQGDLAERQEEAEALAEPLARQSEVLAQSQGGVEEAREAFRHAREEMAAIEAQIGKVAERLKRAEQAREDSVERLQQVRLSGEHLRARREAAAEQFAETGADREALLAALPEEASEADWETQLAQVARRIERLGAINLAAIDELKEAEERETYLSAQQADLNGALDSLEAAMRKIDAETRERFRETFERVNSTFIDRFPKLFGGGEAYLELTEENSLTAGVRVMARPPGKRNSSITMLSGGEKAMTAVALLLALFELNPAPFCLMDEVDAPLDDANVGRFCGVVREMSERVQFIIITHNKITMELAAQLHGVTMQEPGVSRLVSVDVDRAVELTSQDQKTKEVTEIR